MQLYSHTTLIIVNMWLYWDIFTFGHSSLLKTIIREMPLSYVLCFIGMVSSDKWFFP